MYGFDHRGLALALILWGLPAAGTAFAAQAPSTPAIPPVATTGDYEVTGFRSAKFGMTDPEVRAAMVKDLKITAADIKETENPTEHTHVLVATVPNLSPLEGKAEVAYVFGYKTHKLIQVGATWRTALDPKATPEVLVANANTLQTLFLSQGYKAGTVTTNGTLSTGGLLVFRGEDDKKHSTILILQGKTTAGTNGSQTLSPDALVLLYVENTETPDAMKIAPGQF
jgi:hypothetical protein